MICQEFHESREKTELDQDEWVCSLPLISFRIDFLNRLGKDKDVIIRIVFFIHSPILLYSQCFSLYISLLVPFACDVRPDILIHSALTFR